MRSNKYLSKEQTCQLKGLIISAGLDISKMADRMKMSRQTLSSRINGKIDFSKSEMEAFASILETKPDNIFFTNLVALNATYQHDNDVHNIERESMKFNKQIPHAAMQS